MENNVINLQDIIRFDDNGNVTYFKDEDGYTRWVDYDDVGNVIHYKDNAGFESWAEYDEFSNPTHYKNNEGRDEWHVYDMFGRLIYFKNTRSQMYIQYGRSGKTVYRSFYNGEKELCRYNNNGELVNRIEF